MRFCCINNKGWVNNGTHLATEGPAYGDIVTKVEESAENGVLYYELEEWPDKTFRADCFIPINDPKEKEEEEQQEEMKLVEFTEIKKETPVSAN